MKTDKQLGKQVNKHLLNLGIETPMSDMPLQDKDKIDIISKSAKIIMDTLGLDLTDDSLIDTPNRIAKMYVHELFQGLNYDLFPKCTTVDNKMHYDEMVTINNIQVLSTCEHHLITIDGFATVSYIPGDKVIGLSKINRIVRFFCRRPQIQERLTEQIFHTLSMILNTNDVAVKIKATHYCVKSRGIEDQASDTTTTKLGGEFMKPEVRNEFLNLTK